MRLLESLKTFVILNKFSDTFVTALHIFDRITVKEKKLGT